jgi:glycosyltransferase involved in cell wall biosynthesis
VGELGRVTAPIHIVEPTLASEAGHCHTFVEALCRAGDDPRAFRVWCAADAVVPTLERIGVPLERRFHRRVRRLQEWSLLRSLLRGDGRVFVSTAGHTDLLLLDWAARGRIPPRKAYVYVHWVRPTSRKLASFRRLARRQPELVVLGPTPTVVDVFAEAGFAHRAVVPYPTAAPPAPGAPPAFRHLLFAGAAREDKGFSHVVGLVERLAGERPDVRIVLQTSVERNDRRDERTRAALARLSSVRHPSLELRGEALDAGVYGDLFRGAICLQPYDPREFADRVSGITLDAMAAGAPVVTIPGSWIARVVERFGAGEVSASPAPEDLLAAVDRVRGSYRTYGFAALEAGRALRGEHDARRLLEAIRA